MNPGEKIILRCLFENLEFLSKVGSDIIVQVLIAEYMDGWETAINNVMKMYAMQGGRQNEKYIFMQDILNEVRYEWRR